MKPRQTARQIALSNAAKNPFNDSERNGLMYSYAMLCAIKDALERNLQTLQQQGAPSSDLMTTQVALALTRAQIGAHLWGNGGGWSMTEMQTR